MGIFRNSPNQDGQGKMQSKAKYTPSAQARQNMQEIYSSSYVNGLPPKVIDSAIQQYGMTYENDYFTSASGRIFFEDIWLDDISYIAWDVKAPKHPMYGFLSTIFKFPVSGQKLVTGAFAINFKEAAYLHIIFEHIKKNKFRKDINTWEIGDREKHFGSGESFRNKIDIRNIELGMELSSESYQIGKGIRDTKGNLLEGYQTGESVAQFLGRQSDYTFEDKAEELQRQIWNCGKEKPFDLFSANIPPFDIIPTYGDINKRNANQTLHRIMGVYLTGTSQVISVDEESPIQEVYPFIAMDFI